MLVFGNDVYVNGILMAPTIAAGETRTLNCDRCPQNRLLTVRRLADRDPDYKTPGLKLEMTFGAGPAAVRISTFQFTIANMPVGFLHNIRLDLLDAFARNASGLCSSGMPSAQPSADGRPACTDIDTRDASGFTCGARLAYLMGEGGKSERQARAVLATEFPNVCVACAHAPDLSGTASQGPPDPPNGAWLSAVTDALALQCESFSGTFVPAQDPAELCRRSGISIPLARHACARFAGISADLRLHTACLTDYCAVGASDLLDGQEDVLTGGATGSGTGGNAPVVLNCPSDTIVNATLYAQVPSLTFSTVSAFLSFLGGGAACLPRAPPAPPSQRQCAYVCKADDAPPRPPTLPSPSPAAPPPAPPPLAPRPSTAISIDLGGVRESECSTQLPLALEAMLAVSNAPVPRLSATIACSSLAARCGDRVAPNELCYYDARCSELSNSEDPHGHLGCNAGGLHWNCRFCGFGQYGAIPCPSSGGAGGVGGDSTGGAVTDTDDTEEVETRANATRTACVAFLAPTEGGAAVSGRRALQSTVCGAACCARVAEQLMSALQQASQRSELEARLGGTPIHGWSQLILEPPPSPPQLPPPPSASAGSRSPSSSSTPPPPVSSPPSLREDVAGPRPSIPALTSGVAGGGGDAGGMVVIAILLPLLVLCIAGGAVYHWHRRRTRMAGEPRPPTPSKVLSRVDLAQASPTATDSSRMSRQVRLSAVIGRPQGLSAPRAPLAERASLIESVAEVNASAYAEEVIANLSSDGRMAPDADGGQMAPQSSTTSLAHSDSMVSVQLEEEEGASRK